MRSSLPTSHAIMWCFWPYSAISLSIFSCIPQVNYGKLWSTIYLSMYLSIYPSIYRSIYLSTWHGIYLWSSTYLAGSCCWKQLLWTLLLAALEAIHYPHIYLIIYLSIDLSIDLSILSIQQSIHPTIHLSTYPSIHLSVYLSIYQSIYQILSIYLSNPFYLILSI